MDDALASRGLTREHLKFNCPPKIRARIAGKIIDEWYMVGRELDVTTDTLTAIRSDADSEELKAVNALDAWAEQKGGEATFLKLAEALLVRNKKDVVEFLCDEVVRTLQPPVEDGGPGRNPPANGHAPQNGKVVKRGTIENPDRLFNDIAIDIQDKYIEIGIELGLKQKVLTNELETGVTVMQIGSKKAAKMLQLWKQSTSEDKLTYAKLAEALEKHGHKSCAHKHCYVSIAAEQ